MKRALLLYATGLLLVVVFATEETKCGRNMKPSTCFPCNRVCNQPPRPCPFICRVNATYCACESGFSLPQGDSTYCIPTAKCPPKCDT